MKTLLRSVIRDRNDDADLLFRNYQALQDANLPCDITEDTVIWKFVQDFTGQYHHVPDVATVRGHFSSTHQLEVVDRVDNIMVQTARYQGDFLRYLEGRIEDRRIRNVAEILREAGRIVEVGITVKEGKEEKLIRGPMQAIRYVMDRGHEIVTPSTGVKLTGDVTADGDAFIREIERIEADPLAGIGQFSGIDQMDRALRGAKRGELWTHTAFTGGMKSTLALNWLYNQAVYYKHSNILYSLEMPYPQVRRILYAMHSFHEKFDDVRKNLGVKRCVPYQKIRDGEMSPAEREFLVQYVVKDFNDPANQYGSIHIEVADPDKSDFTVIDLRNKAELLRAKDPAISMIVVDHAGLMAPRNRQPSTTERLNEVVRDLKRLSMSFDRGAGIAVLNLFQISREGYKAAEKGGGSYNLTHLSYANECCKYSESLMFSRGLLPICESVVGDRVWSASGWKPVLAVFPKGSRPTWLLATNRGAEFECTENHRVRVLRDEQIDWEYVGNLRAGDYVLGTRGDYPFATDVPKLDAPWGSTTHMTLDLAYLLGAWHGDGRVRPNSVGFTGNRSEQALEDRIADTLERVHGGKKASRYHAQSRPGSFDLELYDTDFKHWFEGVAGDRGVAIPRSILQSPKSFVLAFIQGLFDTDGWITNQGVLGVKMARKSEGLLRGVQTLFTALGYDSFLSARSDTLATTGKTYSSVTLRLRGRESLIKFASDIQFTEKAKAERLNSLAACPTKDKRVYPVSDAFMRVYRAVFPRQHSKKGENQDRQPLWKSVGVAKSRRLVSHGDIEALLQAASARGVNGPDVDLLATVLRLHVVKIVSCSPTGREEQVWDIEVDGDHEYQAGPLLSHNCERSSDIVTAAWIDEELRSKNVLRLQCLKSRDDKPFDPFYAGVVFDCRRIHTAYDITIERAQQAGNEIDLGV